VAAFFFGVVFDFAVVFDFGSMQWRTFLEEKQLSAPSIYFKWKDTPLQWKPEAARLLRSNHQ